MDIAFDRNSWTPEPSGRGKAAARAKAGGNPGTPEWHGLRARLTEARAARLALDEAGSGADSAQAGSFDSVSARLLADFGQSQDVVNPVFWANGKPTHPKDGGVAGETSLGDRG